MANRRDFFKTVAGAAAGVYVAGRGSASAVQAPAGRRQVSIAGKRVRVVDIHSHATVSEIDPVVLNTEYAKQAGGRPLGPDRVALIDKQGIDIQALSINGFWWYEVKDRTLADRIVRAQNQGLAKFVSQYPDRFVGMWVNDMTVDCGPRGREAVQTLLDRGHAAGIIPHAVRVDFVEA